MKEQGLGRPRDIRSLAGYGNIARRQFKNRLFTGLCLFLSILVVIPLATILVVVIKKGGLNVLSAGFFTEITPVPNAAFGTGGIANSLVGTMLLCVLGSLLAVPLGIAAGLYMAFSKRKKFCDSLYFFCNTLQSVPAIVTGIFVYTVLVKPFGSFSLFSAAIAFALVMFPIIALATAEIVKLCPLAIIEASYALGASFYKTIVKVVLPYSAAGIVNGFIVALARSAGEGAFLLFTAFGNPFISYSLWQPTSALPLTIFQFAISPYENWQEIAWGASFVLMALVLLVNIVSKLIYRKKF